MAEEAGRVRRSVSARPKVNGSAFSGFRFPPEVITVAVRWYLRYSLSYRDVEELLAERGVEVDHVTVYRWVQRFTAAVRVEQPAVFHQVVAFRGLAENAAATIRKGLRGGSGVIGGR